MRTHPKIERLLDDAQSARRCAIGPTPADRQGLALRARKGLLVMPYPGVYARREYWNAIDPLEQTRHVARALALLHPRWTFAGLTAATMLGYDHAYALHDGTIDIASSRPGQPGDCARLHRLYMRDVPTVTSGGVRVTEPVRTLIDCALGYSFVQALPIFDAAARGGVDVARALGRCAELKLDTGNVRPLCNYANPLSENGGESTVRAIIIVNGFLVPQVQRPFRNPDNPGAPYRADLTWELSGGRLIVMEYDGMEKYTMQQGTGRRTVQAAVHAERRREDHLRAQGVTAIVRCEYEDILHPERLVAKLTEVGIPRNA